eukprot:TRINITY_DN1585_c1_g1_i1.p1 TRINITY_DN1585_c1_g1~~TRINITY_DN1585_c1_g1_i1.p1  ORF type:complete len:1011 (+),score=266.75 TRINITY_DN1585_c1_g1_i1:116-3034(+)
MGKSRTTLRDVNAETKKIFESVDDDNSGYIDSVEIRRLLKKWGIVGIDHNSLCETFMLGLPKDRGGKYTLNLVEFSDFMQFFFTLKKEFEEYTSQNDRENVPIQDLFGFLERFKYNLEKSLMSRFMEIFDADKSGALDFNEMLLLFLYLNRLEFFYETGDSDGNHELDEKELQSLLRSLKIHVTSEEMKVFMKTAPQEKLTNLNFANFVDLLFYVKDKLPQIKAKAQVSRASNKQKPFKRKAASVDTRIQNQINQAVQRSQEEISGFMNNLRSTNSKWEDPAFPPTNASLWPEEPQKGSVIGRWSRPEYFAPDPHLFVDGVDEGDVIQGAIGDCYLLSAFCVLASSGNSAIEKLFVGSYPEQGVYQCRFYKDAQWHVVTVDDRLPINKMGALHFAQCRDRNEFWVGILEKAYAKLHGNYAAIEHGSIADALTDLTGEPCEVIPSLEETDELWEKLVQNMESGYLMGCSAERDDWENPNQPTDMGLLIGHAYGILQVVEIEGHRLLRLRNPWGSYEWTGAWSDGSKEWTPELMANINFSFGDDGTFFMEFFDWCEQFTRCVIVRMMGDRWDKAPFAGEWKTSANTAGGCLNFPTWPKNPQLKLVCPTRTEVFISLQQEDGRLREHKPYEYPSLGITVIRKKNNDSYQIEGVSSRSEIHALSQFIKARESSVGFWAEANQPYGVVLSTFDPNVETRWFATVCSLGSCQVELANRKQASSSVKGEWSGVSAGGCPDWNTWRRNPQYHLEITEGGEKTVTIVQARREDGLIHAGYVIFPANPEKLPVVEKDKSVFQAKYINSSTVTNVVKLEAGLYNVMPATLKPRFETKFGLLVQGSGAELRPIDGRWNEAVVSSNWTPELCGGCHNNGNADYTKNPIIHFHLDQPGSVTFVLQIDQHSPINGIGFYIFETDEIGGLVNRLDRSDFKTEKEVSKRFQLQSGHYAILPVTYTKGQHGPFQIIGYSYPSNISFNQVN